MKLNEIVNKANELYEEALKKIESKEIESAKEILKTVVYYYSKCIEKRSNLAGLYYKRALAHKLLDNKFSYFIDIFISSTSGFADAKKMYNDEKFQIENKNFIEDKFTLIFEFVHKKIIKEFSCSLLDSQGYLLEKIDLNINSKNIDKIDLEIDLENDAISHCYQNIFSVLYFRLILCDIIVANDFNQNKRIIDRELETEVLNKLLEAKKNISIMEVVKKNYNSQKNKLNHSEVFNLLFSKTIADTENSELNVIIISDCYRELKFKKLI